MAKDAMGSRTVKPIPPLPPLRMGSPDVVLVLDRIRHRLSDLDKQNGSDEHDEFVWFTREYPRCYRHHLDCADFRLVTIAGLYTSLDKKLARDVGQDPSLDEAFISDDRTKRIYWDFESYLSEINIALDLLARIAGTAYEQQMPTSFTKFCKREGDDGPLGVMKQARWVRRLKDYRDCFVHYTPVDTLLGVSRVHYADGFEIRAKLPMNPNVREILGFRFSRRVELLRYAVTVHRHMTALDRAVAKEIARAFARGDYPKRKTGLFFIGQRHRD